MATTLFPVEKNSAEFYLPVLRNERASLPALRAAACGCQGCDLYKYATQTVFGEGPAHARVMLVGEQPGDKEDRDGRPFTGPAGKLLDAALEQAGIARSAVYVTNAVKHFKFEARGKRRIHAKPRVGEINACRPWLEAELDAVRPELVVAMGSTAAQSLYGHAVKVLENRGRVAQVAGVGGVLVTVHPSSILRAVDEAARESQFQAFVSDLRVVGIFLHGKPSVGVASARVAHPRAA